MAPVSFRMASAFLVPHLVYHVRNTGHRGQEENSEKSQPCAMKQSTSFVICLRIAVRCIDHTLAHLILKSIQNLPFAAGHERGEFEKFSTRLVDVTKQRQKNVGRRW